MPDLLSKYGNVMTTCDIAEFLKVGYSTAKRIMQTLPHFNASSAPNNKSRRVLTENFRARYGIPSPLRVVGGGKAKRHLV